MQPDFAEAWDGSGADVGRTVLAFGSHLWRFSRGHTFAYVVAGDVNGKVSVGGNALSPKLLGYYNGKPAWRLGSSTYLFMSVNAGAWVIFGDLREPFAYVVGEYQADGSVVYSGHGDNWLQGGYELPAPDEAAAFEAAGADAMAAQRNGDAAPSGAQVVITADAWRSTSRMDMFDCAGEYEPLYGSSSGTLRIGFWAWRLGYVPYESEGTPVFLDPGDRTKLLGMDGTETQCPGGVWTVARDASGSWTCDLSGATYGAALTATYSLDEGAEDDGGARQPITVPWLGLRVVSGGTDHVYQAARTT